MTYLRGVRTEVVELAENRHILISKKANVRGSLHAPRTFYARPAHATAHVAAHAKPTESPRIASTAKKVLRYIGVGEWFWSLPRGFLVFSQPHSFSMFLSSASPQ